MSAITMSERVVACISKPPNERGINEIEELYPWLTMKTEIFQSKKPEVIKDIIRNCSYVKKVRDDVIIRQGDVGDSFYVILSGRVSIFVQTEAVTENPDDTAVVVGEEAEGEDDGKPKVKKELDRKIYGFCVAQFTPGRGFGELALINRNSIRNASIIADEETDLLEVNRDLFNRCLKAAAEAEFQERVTFVNQCSLFHGWAGRYKRQAAMSLRKDFVEYNKSLSIQGQSTDGLIFILTGQAKIIMDSLMHFSQYPHLHLDEDPVEFEKRELIDSLILDSRPQNTDGSGNNTNGSGDHHSRSKLLWEKPLRRQGYVVAEQRQALKHIEVSLVGPGEIIGDIEQGLSFNTNTQTVICTMKTYFYHLNARNFERLINPKRNFKTLLQLKERAEQKLLVRVERGQNKQIPLIRALVHRIIEERNQEERMLKVREFTGERNNYGDPNQPLAGGVFELKPGPLIDLFGPGTVFYRNRMKRIASRKAEKAKQMAKQNLTGFSSGMHNRAAIAASGVFGANQSDTASVSSTQMGSVTNDSFKSESFFGRSRTMPLNTTKDWETGSDHLDDLEQRIRRWHTDADRIQTSRSAPKEAINLKRYKSATQPRLYSGKKIVLRPRSTRSPLGSHAITPRPHTTPITTTRTTSQSKEVIQSIDNNQNQQLLTSTSITNNTTFTSSTSTMIESTPIVAAAAAVIIPTSSSPTHTIMAINATSSSSPSSPSALPNPSLSTSNLKSVSMNLNDNSMTQIPDDNFKHLIRPQTGSRDVFITSLKSTSRISSASHLSSRSHQKMSSSGKRPSTLKIIPLSNFHDRASQSYQNLQLLHPPKAATADHNNDLLQRRTGSSSRSAPISPDINKFFSPHHGPSNNGKRRPMTATGNPQYTLDDYISLKKLLRRKEMEMVSFRMSMSI